MPYNTNNLKLIATGNYEYVTTDDVAELQTTDYFADFVSTHGGAVNNIIKVHDGIVHHGGETPNNVTLTVTATNGNAATASL